MFNSSFNRLHSLFNALTLVNYASAGICVLGNSALAIPALSKGEPIPEEAFLLAYVAAANMVIVVSLLMTRIFSDESAERNTPVEQLPGDSSGLPKLEPQQHLRGDLGHDHAPH